MNAELAMQSRLPPRCISNTRRTDNEVEDYNKASIFVKKKTMTIGISQNDQNNKDKQGAQVTIMFRKNLGPQVRRQACVVSGRFQSKS